MDRSRTKATRTRIYFTTHRPGAFPASSLPTVVRGERASRSIVNGTTASWSTIITASLVLADVGSMLVSVNSRGRAVEKSLRNEQLYVKRYNSGGTDRPRTKATRTRIYFTTHVSGAFSVLRLRDVVRGERPSRSTVNRTTALWSTIITASLTLAIAGSVPVSV